MWLRYCILLISLVFSQENSTWEIIQSEILNQNCTLECHIQGSSFAEQSDLILTDDVAYTQLVNALPYNTAALSDGLLRVGTEGLPSLYTSFMWEKINAPEHEHFYTDHPYYGSIMPLGIPYLTNGELELIREWILGGAPMDGEVADPVLLEDTTRYELPQFEILPPPENGIQLHLGPFEISSGLDREFFYYNPVEETDEIFIRSVEIVMRPGSHHFIAYTFNQSMPDVLYPEPYEYRDLRDENGNYIQENMIQMAFHKFGVGTQWPRMDYHFPPGIALRINPNFGFDLNSHYINFTDTTMTGEIYLNLHTLQPEHVVKEANILVMNNNDINLPPNQITTLTQTYWIGDMYPEPVSIFQLFSHAHQHMVEFRVYIEGGEQDEELIYVAFDWEHPPILELDPPIYLEMDQGLTLEATYNNWTNETLEFGFLSTDEMMILFGYYFLGESPSAISLSIQEGWNLVGQPFEYENTSVGAIFPQADPGTLYQFNGAYMNVTEMNIGNGYWLYFEESELAVLSGIPVETNEVEMLEGWNLISGISSSVLVGSIYDPQNIIVPGTVYGFNETYFTTNVLSPGNGYWIYANQNGSVVISLNSNQNKIQQSSDSDNLNSISFGNISLYFGTEDPELNPLSFRLPPKPPASSKDIRFSGDTKLCRTNECVIEIMNSNREVILECEINNGEFWEIVDGDGRVTPCSDILVLGLNDISESLMLRKSDPFLTHLEGALYSAYPNPFNPVTTIQFDLPEAGDVSLRVYNLQGKLVETLVNEKLTPEHHTVQWNAEGFSSGVYFVILTSDEYFQSQKMILIK